MRSWPKHITKFRASGKAMVSPKSLPDQGQMKDLPSIARMSVTSSTTISLIRTPSESGSRTGKIFLRVEVGKNGESFCFREVRSLDYMHGHEWEDLHDAKLSALDACKQRRDGGSVVHSVERLIAFFRFRNHDVVSGCLAGHEAYGFFPDEGHVASEHKDVRRCRMQERRDNAYHRAPLGQHIGNDGSLHPLDGRMKVRHDQDAVEDR